MADDSENHDQAMNYVVQPGIFNAESPSHLGLHFANPPVRPAPSRHPRAPQMEEVMNLDALGRYLLHYNALVAPTLPQV